MQNITTYITEKFRVTADFDGYIDFYNDFKAEIDSLFKDKFFEEIPDIYLCLYPKARWSEGLKRDIIDAFNKYGNTNNPCYKGCAWQRSSDSVNKEACKIWEKFMNYIKDNKDELDILVNKEGFTCTYIINTNKALIFLDGYTDIYYSKFSDGFIIIQYK